MVQNAPRGKGGPRCGHVIAGLAVTQGQKADRRPERGGAVVGEFGRPFQTPHDSCGQDRGIDPAQGKPTVNRHADDKSRRKDLADGPKGNHPAFASVAIIGDGVKVDDCVDLQIAVQCDVFEVNGSRARRLTRSPHPARP